MDTTQFGILKEKKMPRIFPSLKNNRTAFDRGRDLNQATLYPYRIKIPMDEYGTQEIEDWLKSTFEDRYAIQYFNPIFLPGNYKESLSEAWYVFCFSTEEELVLFRMVYENATALTEEEYEFTLRNQ